MRVLLHAANGFRFRTGQPMTNGISGNNRSQKKRENKNGKWEPFPRNMERGIERSFLHIITFSSTASQEASCSAQTEDESTASGKEYSMRRLLFLSFPDRE